MTLYGSDVHQLTSKWLHQHQLRLQAVRSGDTPRANRLSLAASRTGNFLSASAEGRQSIEMLLRHDSAYVRGKAAGEVMAWAPELAIPILGHLLDADLSHIASVDERLDIRGPAGDWLHRYFNIPRRDRNDLIEPLRAYGVELTFIDRSSWPEYR